MLLYDQCHSAERFAGVLWLEYRPPKINDMSTMTAFVEPDLADCLGCDVQQLYNYGDTYGHLNTDWKEWRYRGETVLIPSNAVVKDDGKADILSIRRG